MTSTIHSTFALSFAAATASKKAVLCTATKKQKCYWESRYWTVI
ncbi:MAG: hypothetical protein ACRBFS_11850 [Aureispira sp.]